MIDTFSRPLTFLGCVLALAACSSPPAVCMPGASTTCTTNSGCTGLQPCNSTGTAWLACLCSGLDGGAPDGGTDGGAKDAGTSDAGLDAGAADAGPLDGGVPDCLTDDDCRKYNDSRRCDSRNARCVPGVRCNVDLDCKSTDPASYCFNAGPQCRCVAEPGPLADLDAGVCRRRHAVCESCTSSVECGAGPGFNPPGDCKPLTADLNAPRYCFQTNQGACPCGMGDDGGGFCKPVNGTCQPLSCSEDNTCAGGTRCNVPACACEPLCRWDFATRQLIAPGCPSGQTCWVDNANLAASSSDYGVGRCRPPCTGDSLCTLMILNYFGGPRLKCASELLPGGAMSPARCRSAFACMDDLECDAGYCDRGSGSCKTDCRVGLDPTTSAPFHDCPGALTCHADAGVRFCAP
jgi:hypothetical protein